MNFSEYNWPFFAKLFRIVSQKSVCVVPTSSVDILVATLVDFCLDSKISDSVSESGEFTILGNTC